MTQTQQMQLLLYEALAEPIGLLLTSNDPPRALQRLQAARREARDPELAQLIIRVSPIAEGEIVITKVRVELPASAIPRVETQAVVKLDQEDLDLE